MITEAFLTHHMRRRTRRSLKFDSVSPCGLARPPDPPAGRRCLLYLHIPFCEQLCPYCSFNRVQFDQALAESYFRCLREEIRIYRRLGYRFDSVYVGGGTPTVLPAELEKVLKLVRQSWPVENISVETNPNHLRPRLLDSLRDLGVGRLSVGVQTFQDPLLEAIGRLERYGSGEEIGRQLSAAAGRFETLNVDLIFNLPGQTEEALQRDIETVCALTPDQVTWYPLMPAQSVRSSLSANGGISYRQEKRFYRRILEGLSAQYRPTSAWCFSRREQPDHDGNCGKKLIDEYIVDSDHYAGLGCGSFGYVQGTIFSNTFSIPEYIAALSRGRLPIVAVKGFSPKERIHYDFLMKLFSGRLDIASLSRKHGRRVLACLWRELLFFFLNGALRLSGDALAAPGRRIELSRKGYYFWVILMREFFTGVNNFRELCRGRAGSWQEAGPGGHGGAGG